MAIALGIDLGTTNSCAAVATPTGVEFILGQRSERVHPSVVAFPAQGGIVVGADAKRFRLTEPKLRRLAAGRYRVEVRAGRSRTVLGPAATRTVKVAAAKAAKTGARG